MTISAEKHRKVRGQNSPVDTGHNSPTPTLVENESVWWNYGVGQYFLLFHDIHHPKLYQKCAGIKHIIVNYIHCVTSSKLAIKVQNLFSSVCSLPGPALPSNRHA